jgi:integrase
VNGHLAIGPTKTGKRRRVSIPPFLIDILEQHRLAFGNGGGHMFNSAEESPLHHAFYRRHFQPPVRRAGVPDNLRFRDYADIRG